MISLKDKGAEMVQDVKSNPGIVFLSLISRLAANTTKRDLFLMAPDNTTTCDNDHEKQQRGDATEGRC